MTTQRAPDWLHRLLPLVWGAVFVLAVSACQGTQPRGSLAFRGAAAGGATPAASETGSMPPPRLPDLSGLAWAGTDTLLAVHDAKASPQERDCPRASLLMWPTATNRTLHWRPLAVAWPAAHGPGSDLESIAHVPETRQFILAESGANREPVAHLFLTTLRGDSLRIRHTLEWPIAVENVEATAVARRGEHLLFLYAERWEGRSHTDIGVAAIDRAALRRGQLRLGPFTHERFYSGTPAGPGERPITALEVGPAGGLYVTSAYDAGRDDGPFRSTVWKAGRLQPDASGAPRLALFERPRQLARLDGLKAEGVAARRRGDAVRLVVGTDDEGLGAALRPLPDTEGQAFSR